MDNFYDVIVVGAGPAGSMAAMEASKEGAKTLLLEKHPEIGRPICCAEGITAFGLERVIKPRPEWISTRVVGAVIEGPSGAKLTFYHQGAGYVLNRDTFDAGLAQLASDSGAQIEVSAPAVSLKLKGENIESVTVNQNGATREIGARIVVAADGVESRIAHFAGLDTHTDPWGIDTACQYLIEGLEFKEMLIALVVGNEVAPGGYAWIFPKSEKSANVGVAISPARSNGENARVFLDRFIKDRYPECRKVGIMMGGTPIFDKGLPLVKGNLMVVGDAARVLDSLSGAGISNAMLSGSIAGSVAAKSLRQEARLIDYQVEFMKLKSRELNAYKLFRTMLVRASDDEFEQVIHALDDFFPEKKVQDIDVPDIILKLIFRNPGLFKLARYLVTK